jgi:hypothetical protein
VVLKSIYHKIYYRSFNFSGMRSSTIKRNFCMCALATLKKAFIYTLGVIQLKKTFDMCYQTLSEPHRSNKIKIGQLVVFLMNS